MEHFQHTKISLICNRWQIFFSFQFWHYIVYNLYAKMMFWKWERDHFILYISTFKCLFQLAFHISLESSRNLLHCYSLNFKIPNIKKSIQSFQGHFVIFDPKRWCCVVDGVLKVFVRKEGGKSNLFVRTGWNLLRHTLFWAIEPYLRH